MPNFTASTADVLKLLGLNNSKTLFRRRTDFHESRRKRVARFLEPGIHFRRKSPESKALVWDPELTLRAWEQALSIRTSEQCVPR